MGSTVAGIMLVIILVGVLAYLFGWQRRLQEIRYCKIMRILQRWKLIRKIVFQFSSILRCPCCTHGLLAVGVISGSLGHRQFV